MSVSAAGQDSIQDRIREGLLLDCKDNDAVKDRARRV